MCTLIQAEDIQKVKSDTSALPSKQLKIIEGIVCNRTDSFLTADLDIAKQEVEETRVFVEQISDDQDKEIGKMFLVSLERILDYHTFIRTVYPQGCYKNVYELLCLSETFGSALTNLSSLNRDFSAYQYQQDTVMQEWRKDILSTCEKLKGFVCLIGLEITQFYHSDKNSPYNNLFISDEKKIQEKVRHFLRSVQDSSSLLETLFSYSDHPETKKFHSCYETFLKKLEGKNFHTLLLQKLEKDKNITEAINMFGQLNSFVSVVEKCSQSEQQSVIKPRPVANSCMSMASEIYRRKNTKRCYQRDQPIELTRMLDAEGCVVAAMTAASIIPVSYSIASSVSFDKTYEQCECPRSETIKYKTHPDLNICELEDKVSSEINGENNEFKKTQEEIEEKFKKTQEEIEEKFKKTQEEIEEKFKKMQDKREEEFKKMQDKREEKLRRLKETQAKIKAEVSIHLTEKLNVDDKVEKAQTEEK